MRTEGRTAKRLELLSELVPRAGVIALLVNPNTTNAERVIQDVQQAARAKGVKHLQMTRFAPKPVTRRAFDSSPGTPQSRPCFGSFIRVTRIRVTRRLIR